MFKTAGCVLTVILCTALLAACGDSGDSSGSAATTRTATVPSGTLGDAARERPFSPSQYDQLVRFHTTLTAKVTDYYERLDQCYRQAPSDRRTSCLANGGYSAYAYMVGAVDQLGSWSQKAPVPDGTCAKDLLARAESLGAVGRAMNLLSEYARRSGTSAQTEEAFADLTAAHEKSKGYTISASCRP